MMPDFRTRGDDMYGFTHVVTRVRDVASVVVPARDMGRGVSCFWFALPEGMTPDELAMRFAAFAKKSKIFQPIIASEHNAAMYSYLSMTHLGEDGYMGIYECGAEDTNEYMLVVQSYDISAALAFQDHTYARVRHHVDEAVDLDMRESKLEKITRKNMFIGTKPYENAIRKSNLNRRYLAANFFDAFGIRYSQEQIRIDGQEDVIMACSESQAIGDYLCTYLKPEGSSFLRLYNSAYSYDDILNGAPWHLSMHEGLKTFHGSEKIRSEKKGKFIKGVPMGTGYVPANPMATSYNADDAARINTIVTWQSAINTMYIADPKTRVETKIEFANFEREYELDTLRPRHWRALGVAVLPPYMCDMKLRELITFSDTPNIMVPTRMHEEIVCIQIYLHAFKRHNAGEIVPTDYAVPRIIDLFMNEKVEASECEMEKGMLKRLVDNHDMIISMLDTQEDDHEMYVREDTRPHVFAHSPSPPPSDRYDNNAYVMPIGESGSDASTGMSDVDVRTLRDASMKRELRRNARSRTPSVPAATAQVAAPSNHTVQKGRLQNTRKPETILHKMLPQSNGFHVQSDNGEEGAETDFYDDLGIVSTDDDRR